MASSASAADAEAPSAKRPRTMAAQRAVPVSALDTTCYASLDSGAVGWQRHITLPGWARLESASPAFTPLYFDAKSACFFDSVGAECHYDTVTGEVVPIVPLVSGDAAHRDAQRLQDTVFARLPALVGAHASMQGRRPTQEDRHTVLDALDVAPQSALYAVYDGHLGREASDTCARVLPYRLAAGLRHSLARAGMVWPSDGTEKEASAEAAAGCEAREKAGPCDGGRLPEDVTVTAENMAKEDKGEDKGEDGTGEPFPMLVAGLAALWRRVVADLDREVLHQARVRKRRDGSCLVAALCLGRLLAVAHLGDSRAILCRDDGSMVSRVTLLAREQVY